MLGLGSALLWGAVVGGAWWYLDRAAAREYRMGVRPITDPDSYGLPLLSFGLALGACLLVLNVAAAGLLLWRRRRQRRRSAPRAAV